MAESAAFTAGSAFYLPNLRTNFRHVRGPALLLSFPSYFTAALLKPRTHHRVGVGGGSKEENLGGERWQELGERVWRVGLGGVMGHGLAQWVRREASEPTWDLFYISL